MHLFPRSFRSRTRCDSMTSRSTQRGRWGVSRMANIEPLEPRDLLTTIGFAEHAAEPIACCGHLLADIDGDGLDDWVWGSSTLQWSPNLGNAAFGSSVFIGNLPNASYYDTRQLIGTDLDGDNDVDLLRLSLESVSWYENRDGRGNFGPAVEIIDEDLSGIASIAAGDLSNDGMADIVVSFSQKVQGELVYQSFWLRNDGGGRFSKQATFDGLRDTTIFDFDRDGDFDLLSIRHANREIVWLENVHGELASEVVLADGIKFDVGDINGDGHADIVSEGGFGFTIHTNNGTRTFTSTGYMTDDSRYPGQVFLADFDDDGDLDIFREVIGLDSRSVALHENIDGSTFVARPLDVFEPYSHTNAYIGDINGDGGKDLLGNGYWFRFDADADAFHRRRIVGESQPAFASRQMVDLTGDGNDELLYNAPCETRYGTCDSNLYWRTLGSELVPGAHENRITTDGQYPMFFQTGDFDGDGDKDIVAITTVDHYSLIDFRMIWLEHLDGRGAFSPAKIIYEQFIPGTPQIIDLNRDGMDEILISTGGSNPRILRLDAQTFSVETLDVRGSQAIIETDLNNDGLNDLLIPGRSSYQIMNSENGLKAPELILVSADEELPLGATRMTDVNGDGWLDIVTTDSYSGDPTSRATWIENNGDGTFENRASIPAASGMRLVETADLNSDGAVDLIFQDFDVQNAFSLRVAYNDGNGDFPSTRSLGIKSIKELRDVDDDGDLDIIGHDLTWYENRPLGDANGDGLFDSSDLVQVFQSAEYEDDVLGNSTFQEGDWNGDGDFDSSDLVVAMQRGDYQLASRPKQAIAAFDDLFADRKKTASAFRP